MALSMCPGCSVFNSCGVTAEDLTDPLMYSTELLIKTHREHTNKSMPMKVAQGTTCGQGPPLYSPH